ncbi:MAG: hypothetical protein LBT00_15590, partial [Spirochaetaceae bacterium]|nr:hypothetical protein [Spirochaetaceae bacterium]
AGLAITPGANARLVVDEGAALVVESGGTIVAVAANSVAVADGGALVVEAPNSVSIGNVEFDPGAYADIVEVDEADPPQSLTATLVTALNNATPSSAEAIGPTVTLLQSVSLSSGEVTVPLGVTLDTSTFTLTVSGATLTVAGTLAGTGRITGDGEFNLENATVAEGSTVLTVDATAVADLAATGAPLVQAKRFSGKGVVQLTEAFYSNASTNAVVVDANDTDNDKPYTIRGLGKENTALTVAIHLANDNVTLEDVKIAVTVDSKAKLVPWLGSDSNPYRTALFIGRADGSGLLAADAAASNHVTVRNCDITATGLANFTAGIYVWAQRASPNIYPSTYITIDQNTITATGNGGASVQGIALQNWDPTIVITDNAITARYGAGSRPVNPFSDAPASAIFVNRAYDTKTPNAGTDPTISGNTLVADAYSFYINARDDTIPASGYDPATGIASFRTRNFANASTTWATDPGNTTVYRKLFDALKANVTGTGLGYVATLLVAFDPAFINAERHVETYEITNGNLVAISVLGGIISGDAYTYNTSGTVNRFVSGSDSPKGYDYGRKRVGVANDATTWNDATQNKFCYRLNATGTGYEYDTDLSFSANGSGSISTFPSGE